MAAKVFVGNLAFQTTRDQLQTLFEQVGPVIDVFLPSDKATGRPRGFAFVEFESAEAAEQAIERFEGYELEGRALRVNPAEDKPARPRSFGDAPRPPYGGGGGGGGFGGGKSKGSRRNVRARKRSL